MDKILVDQNNIYWTDCSSTPPPEPKIWYVVLARSPRTLLREL
jgi:hypothetical protein